MEGRGAVSPGILTLTTGLSKPFMRLDKYPTLLKELERHMEVCVCHWIAIFLQLLCLAFFVKCTTCLPFLGESPRQTRHPEVHVVFQKSVGKLNSLPLQTDTTRNQTFYEMKWFKKRFWNSRLSLSRQAQCQEVRKRKELELQILTESIRLWEGDDIKTLGSVIYMSQVLVQSQLSEVFIWLLHLYFALL